MTRKLRLALIGIGKIARDQHLPAIAASADFSLAAAVSRRATVDGVAHFPDIAALIASGLAIDAVAIATPPVGRHAIAGASDCDLSPLELVADAFLIGERRAVAAFEF